MTGKPKTIGSRVQVMNGAALKTSGGLTKKDIMLNKWGLIVSKKKHAAAVRRWKSVEAIFEANRAPPFDGADARRPKVPRATTTKTKLSQYASGKGSWASIDRSGTGSRPSVAGSGTGLRPTSTDAVTPLVAGAPRMSWTLLRSQYIPASRRARCENPEPSLEITDDNLEEISASWSVTVAIGIYIHNKKAFDASFVGEIPPDVRRQGDPECTLHYVSYATFRKELDCSIDLFLRSLEDDGGKTQVELYIPWLNSAFFNSAHPFRKSNMWTSLLALPRLADRLSRVRILKTKSGVFERYLAGLPVNKKVRIVMVDDGIYSAQQFFDESGFSEVMKWCIDKRRTNIYVDVIVPYVSPKFLLKTGIPENKHLLAYETARSILKKNTIGHPEASKYMQEDETKWEEALRQWCQHHVESTTGHVIEFNDLIAPPQPCAVKAQRIITMEDIVRFLKEYFPAAVASDPRVRCYLLHKWTIYRHWTLEELKWMWEYLTIHNTVIMDNEPGRNLTSFYFAHKVPDNFSSTASSLFQQVWKQTPPYMRHKWHYSGFSDFDLVKKCYKKSEADILECL